MHRLSHADARTQRLRTIYSARRLRGAHSKALQHALPLFVIDNGTTYTAQGGTSSRITGPFDTTVLQANSALGPDVTHKIEQNVLAHGHEGFMDQLWFAYHNILHRAGHPFIEKLPAINLDDQGAPIVVADVNDAGQSRVPFIAVGVHQYASDYIFGRWGAKFNYVPGKTLVEAAYLANPSGSGSFGNAYDFSRTGGTSFQWRVAYADPAKPYELGVSGKSGTYGCTGSELAPGIHDDNYNVFAPYIIVAQNERPAFAVTAWFTPPFWSRLR